MSGQTPFVVGAVFIVLTAFERRRPLRPARESKLRRLSRNLAFAGLGAATVNLLERPVVEPLASLVERRRWGLLYGCRLSRPLHVALAILILDYTLYVWHSSRNPFKKARNRVRHVIEAPSWLFVRIRRPGRGGPPQYPDYGPRPPPARLVIVQS